jgi:mono/diheme cytochrome c family protein
VPFPAPVAAPAAAPASAGPGIYTAAQAAQGQQVFRTVCSACHGMNEFTGPIFQMTWMADPVGHLFQHISVAMPQDSPGSLKPEEYAAVVAYFLQLNGRPPGTTPLPTDLEQLSKLTW